MNWGAVFDGLSARVPHPESEYMGEDGLLHCSVCHKRTERMACVPSLGINRKVRCICDCMVKEEEALKERERQQELDRQRRLCFCGTNMADWTFANDDRQNPKISDAMFRYVENFAEFRQEGKGLLLYGTVGTGKTYYAAAIANALIDKGFNVTMTNFAWLSNQIQETWEKNAVIEDLNRKDLVILDDLGAERRSEYMQEMVFNIIDSRYRSGLPFIVTTNLTAEEIKKPQEVSFSRIYDRILERCFPVEITGHSRRRQSVKETYFDTKAKLGL